MKNYVSINIIYIRKINYLSQEELGIKIGTTSHSVSAYEREKTLPGIDTVQKLCNEFNISIDDFINRDLSQLPKAQRYTEEEKETYQTPDNDKNAIYELLTDTIKEQLKLKDALIESKEKTNAVLEQRINGLEREKVMLEALLNQNAVATDSPLLDFIASLVQANQEIEKIKNKKPQ
ncbi:MAG: helix-turn-helix transcriptional regulator [Flavobacteriales bacterium]